MFENAGELPLTRPDKRSTDTVAVTLCGHLRIDHGLKKNRPCYTVRFYADNEV